MTYPSPKDYIPSSEQVADRILGRQTKVTADQMNTPHPAETHRYITTNSGIRVSCPGMRSSMVDLRDIAHSLSMQCRYMGHVNEFYSVAEHSVLVSRFAKEAGFGLDMQIMCFLHDAHEAYVGDFPSPFKEAVPGLRLFEDSIESAVRDSLGLPADDDPAWGVVKHFDILALHLEASQLFIREHSQAPDWVDWDMVHKYHARTSTPPGPIDCWDWKTARAKFLARAGQLKLL